MLNKSAARKGANPAICRGDDLNRRAPLWHIPAALAGIQANENPPSTGVIVIGGGFQLMPEGGKKMEMHRANKQKQH